MGDENIPNINDVIHELSSRLARNEVETEKLRLMFANNSSEEGQGIVVLSKTHLPERDTKTAICKQVVYNLAVIVQISLPSEDSKEAIELEVRNGEATILVKAGKKTNDKNHIVSTYFPSSSFPRQVMLFINEYVLEHKRQKIYLGNNRKDFLEGLGYKNPQGDIYARYHENMERLLYCSLSTGNNDSVIKLSSHVDVWKKGERTSRKCYIHLSDDMYKKILEHPLPVDMNIVQKIQGCSLRLDVYALMLDMMQPITQDGQEIIHWEDIADLLGANREKKSEFYTGDFRTAFEKVSKYFTDSQQIEYSKKGLIVRGSVLSKERWG